MNLSLPQTGDAALLQAQFAALRAQYIAKLPARMIQLAKALASAQGDPTQRRQALRLAHNLRGTSASYGLGELAASLGALEDLLEGPPSGHEAADLRRVLAKAQDVIDDLQGRR